MLAANIESFLIFLLIAGGSALFNWLKKRKEESQDATPSDPSPRPQRRGGTVPPQTASKPTNWEEELRRMLEGVGSPLPVPTTKSPPRREPPRENRPNPVALEPRTEPTMSLPTVFTESKFYKAHCNHCDGHIEFPPDATDEVISCPHCQRPTVLRPFQETRVETLAHQTDLSSFASATKKYDAASHLNERVAAHMHGVGHRPVGLTSIETTKKLWPEIAETKALFRNSKTVRQAMIASLIFGPPKALEN